VEAEQELVIKENPLLTRAQARDIAIARAITYCKKHGILEDFLEKLSPEEVNMIATEWSLEDAIKVAQEEAWEDGMEKGMDKGQKLFSSLIEQAESMDDLRQMFAATFTRQS
jgi:hypothetical protein